MKPEELKSAHYRFLIDRFKDWMQLKKYKEITTDAYLQALAEFFHYLEQNNVLNIKSVEQKHFTSFKNQLKVRPNMKSLTGGIRNMTINGIVKGVNCFVKHFNSTTQSVNLDIYEKYLPVDTKEKIILTQEEVMDLYNATFHSNSNGNIEVGQRDRTMIGVFYGCGIRLNEGRNINLSDIDFQNKRILVRYGKKGKERYVPIPNQHLEDIKTYIQQSRYWFKYHHYNTTVNKRPIKKDVPQEDEDALFLTFFGTRQKSYQHRLDILQERAMIEKKIGTHTLRHSVATHLILNDWEVEDVSTFLGHASIDSTQIYIHIAEQLKNI